MAGLHREVFVEARGATHIASPRLRRRATIDVTGTGTLTVTATLGGLQPPDDGWQVRIRVETLGGSNSTAAAMAGRVRPRVRRCRTSSPATRRPPSFELPDVEPWSAESPTRYRVVCELIDSDR